MTSAEPKAGIPGPEEGPRALTPKNIRIRLVLLAVLVSASVWLLWFRPPPGSTQAAEAAAVSGRAMGTTWSVKLGQPAPDGLDLQAGIQAVLDDLEGKMSTWDRNSELSRFNASTSTEPMPVSDDTLRVVAIALEVSAKTDGAFDITVGPLIEAWGFNTARREEWSPPTDQALARAQQRVGFEKLAIDPSTLAKTEGELEIDISAVAKGDAVDQVALWLESNDIDRYMVEVGGEVRVLGQNAENEPWRIGIESPDSTTVGLDVVVPMTEGALATSGTYRNFVDRDGVRYSHIIDPRSAKPVEHRLVSVSVRHRSCGWADAWATALLALGPDEGFAVAEREGLVVRFVSEAANGERVARTTAGW